MTKYIEYFNNISGCDKPFAMKTSYIIGLCWGSVCVKG